MSSVGGGKGRVARRSAFAVGLVALVLVAVLATRQPANMVMANSPLVGRPAPPIAARSFDGRTVSLKSLRGRWVVVNFFASWCAQCRQEEPQLEQFLYSHPAGQPTAVLGVLYGDTLTDGRSFQAAEGATWTSVVDPEGVIASQYGVGSLPRSYLVDPGGRVVASIEGAVSSSQLGRWIAQEAARGG